MSSMTDNTRYALNLKSYPLRKMQELYPIIDEVIIEVTCIPVSDEFIEKIQQDPSGSCVKYNKDIIVCTDINTSYIDDEDEDSDVEILDEDYEYGDHYYNMPDGNSIKYSDFAYDFDIDDIENTDEGTGWIFMIKFVNPIIERGDIEDQYILSKTPTVEAFNKLSFSIVCEILGGIQNIIYSDTINAVINVMSNIILERGRLAFIGFAKMVLEPKDFDVELKAQYIDWMTYCYNLLLEDYIDYELRLYEPVVFGNMQYKRTDFMGQYYFPNGIKLKRKE